MEQSCLEDTNVFYVHDCDVTDPLITGNEPKVEKATWVKAQVNLLTTLYEEYRPQIGTILMLKTKQKLWRFLALKMREKGCNFSPMQIENKWKSLQRGLKSSRNKAACDLREENLIQKNTTTTSSRSATPEHDTNNWSSDSESSPRNHRKLGEARKLHDLYKLKLKNLDEQRDREQTKAEIQATKLLIYRERAEQLRKELKQLKKEKLKKKDEAKLTAYRERTAELKRKNNLFAELIEKL